MEYKIAKIEKTNDGIEVEVQFLEDEEVVDSRKYLYNTSLEQDELESAVRKDAEGVIADYELRITNAERDRHEREVDAKVEGLKESFDLK
ncbi:MAG: hypothetical protein HY006_04065 [Candidatus Sungbacteria bacterium]|nr:hypothetical protein [Candidatus Sungbacteria bacterium]